MRTAFGKDWKIGFSHPTGCRLSNPADALALASSTAPQVSFDADGRARSETNANGRTIQTTASLNGSVLTIRTQGDRANDFQVTFRPVDNGRSLQVTRRIYNDRLTQPLETLSFYTSRFRCRTSWMAIRTYTQIQPRQRRRQPAAATMSPTSLPTRY